MPGTQKKSEPSVYRLCVVSEVSHLDRSGPLDLDGVERRDQTLQIHRRASLPMRPTPVLACVEPAFACSIYESIQLELKPSAAVAASIFCLLLLSATGCTVSSHQKSSGYTNNVKASFISGCLETSRGAKGYCGCVYTQLEKSVPFTEFVAYNNAAATSGTIDAKTESDFNRVTLTCSLRSLSPAERKSNVYPEPLRTNLVLGCEKAAKGNALGCLCVVGRLEKTTPLKDLIAADTAMRFSEPVNAKTQRELQAASVACLK